MKLFGHGKGGKRAQNVGENEGNEPIMLRESNPGSMQLGPHN